MAVTGRKLTEADRALLASVASDASADAGGLPASLLDGYLTAIVGAAATSRRMTRSELDSCRRLGAQAARDGAPLPALVDLYMSATWMVWPHLPELVRSLTGSRVPADTVLRMGSAVLRAADNALASLAAGYAEARQEIVRREEALRREFVDDLLGGQAEVGRLVERAERFGLNLAAHHVVAVAAADDRLPNPGTTASVETALRGRAGGRNVLVASKDGQLLCVVPLAAYESAGAAGLASADAQMLNDAAAVLGQELGAGWRAAVGRAHAGPLGVSRSYADAREALDLATRLGVPERVVHLQQLLVYRVLLRDAAAMGDLVLTVVGPLAEARGGAEPMLETLAAYFSTGGNAAEAARRLHLSVRAVTYRLERVRELTGYRAADPAQRLPLEVAVLGARLLGWPGRQLPPGQ